MPLGSSRSPRLRDVGGELIASSPELLQATDLAGWLVWQQQAIGHRRRDAKRKVADTVAGGVRVA